MDRDSPNENGFIGFAPLITREFAALSVNRGFFRGQFRTMHIETRRAKDRVKATLLHGGSKIKISIRFMAEWFLLRDRLDDAVSDALRGTDQEKLFLLWPDVPEKLGPLPLTCDLTDVDCESDFEQRITTIYRVMDRQHPDDARLTVLISAELRSQFDSAEWACRQDCASEYNVTLVPVAVASTKGEDGQ